MHTGLPQLPVRGVSFLRRLEAKRPPCRAGDDGISLPHPGVSGWTFAERRFVIFLVRPPPLDALDRLAV